MAEVPAHLGLIIDGNRRWARQRGKPTLEGHKAGSDNVQVIVEAALDQGVKWLSIFAFSTENWKRTDSEAAYLMKLFYRMATAQVDQLHDKQIRVCFLGREEGLDAKVVEAFRRAEAKTAANARGTLVVCVNYGGQQEIVDAVGRAAASGGEIGAQDIEQNLYHPEVPPVDLIIRTSGEQRLSGFMLWRAAYAELYFSPKLWPDFTPADLQAALADYAQRARRFGQ